MIGIVLSIFDALVGPRVLLKYPKSIESIHVDHIPKLMDVFEEGFIVYEFGDLKTANFVFEVNNPVARGRKDILMISVISHHERYHLNLISFKEIIEKFVKRIEKMHLGCKGIDHRDISGESKEYRKLKRLINSFYDILPKENTSSGPNLRKRLTFELSTLGKSDIISQLSRINTNI